MADIESETSPPATTRLITRDVRPNHESEIVNREWLPDILIAMRFENFSIDAPSDGGR